MVCPGVFYIFEDSTQWANLAERYIGIIKEVFSKDMQESNSLLVLWCYCIENRTRVYNITARYSFLLDVQNPYLVRTGDRYDILNLCPFKFYDWVYYWDQNEGLLESKCHLG